MANCAPTRVAEPPQTRSAIAFGANLPSLQGGPRETLERAAELLVEAGVTIHRRSRWYTTPAWPSGAGPDYVNGAAEVSFAAGPLALLHTLQAVETVLGRVRGARATDRWRARVCDLDLVCHGDLVMPGPEEWRDAAALAPEEPLPELVLPHPRLQDRVFVLAPMLEVAPDWRHPVLGRTVREMFAAHPQAARDEARPLRT